MRYVALLRAINVGGRTVTMTRLREVFVADGFQNVTTMIASGNVLFDSRATNRSSLEQRIESMLHAALGFDVDTMVRSSEQLAAIAAFEPFGARSAASAGTTEYVAFLKRAPDADAIARAMQQASDADALHVAGSELYWQRRDRAASRFSGSTLERALGMPATVRKTTTVRKLAAL